MKTRSVLRAQKNVGEENHTKGVPAPSAHPTVVFFVVTITEGFVEFLIKVLLRF